MRSSSVDARIAQATTPGFPVVTRDRLRRAGVHRTSVAVRVADGRLTHAWSDTFLVGSHDLQQIPTDFVRRAAVATVEPRAALGGVSAIERRAGWDRFEATILVVSDRRHPHISKHGVHFRRVDIDRELDAMSELRGVPTCAALPAIMHAARDLTPHQTTNAIGALRYHSGLRLQSIREALDHRDRVIGAPVLRRALELADGGSSGTKSRSEDVLLPYVTQRYGEPLVNVRGAAGMPDYEPDMLWPRRRWIIEVDGRHHFEDEATRLADLARDELLRSAGWIVVRIPWWWVWHRRAYALRVIEHAFRP